jgi:hypothetical protein
MISKYSLDGTKTFPVISSDKAIHEKESNFKYDPNNVMGCIESMFNMLKAMLVLSDVDKNSYIERKAAKYVLNSVVGKLKKISKVVIQNTLDEKKENLEYKNSMNKYRDVNKKCTLCKVN